MHQLAIWRNYNLEMSAELLQPQTASNEIGLIANARQLVAHPSEAQHIDGVTVGLQIIRAARHRFARLGIFEGQVDAIQASIERLLFSIDVSRPKALFLILIAMSELFHGQSFL